MNLTEKALKVAGEGYPVFPCSRNKRPCWSNEELGAAAGEGGLKIATRDPEEMRVILMQPQTLEILERASLFIGFGLIAQAAFVGWAALRLSNWWWLLARSAGFYVMMTVVVILAWASTL